MSLLCSRFIPAFRNISPTLRKSFIQYNGIRRNYWSRRDAFSELSTAMRSVENCMKEMDKELNRVFGDIQRVSPVKFSRIFSPFGIVKEREIPVVSNEDGRLYKLELDMEGMKPENINITLRDNTLTVTARRDETSDDGSRFVRENSYHYTLPDGINPDAIRSSLTGGVLTIEAPLPTLESKEIPVNIENGKNRSSNSESEKTK